MLASLNAAIVFSTPSLNAVLEAAVNCSTVDLAVSATDIQALLSCGQRPVSLQAQRRRKPKLWCALCRRRELHVNGFCAVHNRIGAALHHGNVKLSGERDNRRLIK